MSGNQDPKLLQTDGPLITQKWKPWPIFRPKNGNAYDIGFAEVCRLRIESSHNNGIENTGWTQNNKFVKIYDPQLSIVHIFYLYQNIWVGDPFTFALIEYGTDERQKFLHRKSLFIGRMSFLGRHENVQSKVQ